MGVRWRWLVPLIIVLLSTSPLSAQEYRPRGAEAYGDPALSSRTHFTPAERHLIRAFFAAGDRHQTAPRRQLPPGLQNNLQRGKPLPPGWQKKVVSGRSLDYRIYRQGTALPAALQKRLSTTPSGVETIRVADLIIRLNAATRNIIDFFRLAGAR